MGPLNSGILPKENASTLFLLCDQRQQQASAVREFYTALVPTDNHDAPRRKFTLNLGLIKQKLPQNCLVCAIIVDLRKCIDYIQD